MMHLIYLKLMYCLGAFVGIVYITLPHMIAVLALIFVFKRFLSVWRKAHKLKP